MKRILAIIIAIGFGLYAVARLSGGAFLLFHAMGVFETAAAEAALGSLQTSLPEMNDVAIIPFSLTVYLGYSILMGFILLFGAAGVLLRRKMGPYLVIAYYGMFGLMFLNFQTANVKLLHFGVGLFFAVILYLLSRGEERASPRSQASTTR